jgi:hypothetical protein
MSRENQKMNMNGSPKRPGRPFLWSKKRPLVNHHLQEYHAPSVFTSHVADILKTSVFITSGHIVPEEGFS